MASIIDKKNRQLRKEMQELFYKSLEEDNDRWEMNYLGAAEYSWIEYNSPDYKNISYSYSTLGHDCEIYINGYKEYSFKVSLFKITKIRKLLNKIEKRYSKLVANIKKAMTNEY